MRFYREYDASRGCVICNGGMPADRKLTCSHECLQLYRAQLAELRGEAPFRELPKGARKELVQHQREIAHRSGKVHLRRNCDHCGKEFFAKTSRTMWCSPACQVIKTGSCSLEYEGPSKPSLKDSEFKFQIPIRRI